MVQNDASFGFAARASIASRAAAREAMLDLEGHCARFFNDSGIDLVGMVPDGRWASSGICMVAKGRRYIVYSQSGSSVTVNLSTETGEFVGRWYDPRTGQFSTSFTVQGGNAAVSINKPGGGDAVLHLEKKGS